MTDFDQELTLRCTACKGAGTKGKNRCPVCEGSGERKQAVNIRDGQPVGHHPGSPVEVSREGEPVVELDELELR